MELRLKNTTQSKKNKKPVTTGEEKGPKAPQEDPRAWATHPRGEPPGTQQNTEQTEATPGQRGGARPRREAPKQAAGGGGGCRKRG